MKTNNAGNQSSVIKEQQHSGRRADNKNSLDHREGEEQVSKKGDVTHNKKEKHSQNRKPGK